MYHFIDWKIILPLAERQFGSRIKANYYSLKESEWWSREQIENFQISQMKNLLEHAYKNVPYYTDLFNSIGFKPEHYKKLTDVEAIPILSKELIRDNYDKLITKDIDERKFKTHTTGGSTGVPLNFLSDMDTWSIQWASSYRAYDWYGHELGDKIFTIGGHSLVSDKKKFSKKDVWDKIIMRNFKYSSSGMTNEDMKYYYKKLIALKPKALRGYASSLYVFARFIEDNRLPIPNVKRILTTGEQLMPNYKAKLQEVFRAPLFDEYGAGDGGIISNECYMHEGYHITEEACYIEIVNAKNEVIENGKLGKVITTDLRNFSFPFIRYDVGDLAVMKTNLCSCGRKTRLLDRIEGRSGRLIYTQSGIPISPTMLPILLYKDLDYNKKENQEQYNKIDKFKIIQDEKGNLLINLKLKAGEHLKENEYSHITMNYKNYFPGSDVELKFVEKIETLGSGKDDYVESKFTKFNDYE